MKKTSPENVLAFTHIGGIEVGYLEYDKSRLTFDQLGEIIVFAYENGFEETEPNIPARDSVEEFSNSFKELNIQL